MKRKLLLLVSMVAVLLSIFMPMSLSVSAQSEDVEESIDFEPGIYVGNAEAHNGLLEVEVEFSETDILSVEVVRSSETEHLAEIPFKIIPEIVVMNQTVEVDTITGATITSVALINAIKDAITQAGANPELLADSTESSPESQETINLEADVVVIGGGGAGLSAALTADQNGMSVVLLEKNATFGGHTVLSGAYTLVTGSNLQEEMGVTDDSLEKVYDDIMENGGNESVPELLTLYTEIMGPATDWTVDYVDAPIPDSLTPLGENQVDRALVYEGGGKGLIDALENKLLETEIDYYMETRATELITEDNVVTGVLAEGKDGTVYEVKGQAIVLATGSYGARNDLLPDTLDNFVYYGAALASGDGLEMAQEVDADTVNMGYVELFENGVEWLPGIAKSTYNGSMAAWNQSGILVDRNGVRVVNERGPGKDIAAQQAAQEDGTLFLLMDQATFDIFRDNVGGYGISEEMLDGWLENNGEVAPVFAHAETIDGVAEIAGVDGESLQKTIETYNEYVENGEDLDFGRDPQYMTAQIGEGPYYLVEQKPRYATTLGGLLINTDLQVINTEGEVISGLYAVGDTAGGVRGNDSIPGSDVGWALASGYYVGQVLEEMLELSN